MASFRIIPEESQSISSVFKFLQNEIKTWILSKEKTAQTFVNSDAFLNKGKWTSSNGGVTEVSNLETTILADENSQTRGWALKYLYPDQNPLRRWIVDLAIGVDPKGKFITFHFNTAFITDHSEKFSFEFIPPNIPRVVNSIIEGAKGKFKLEFLDGTDVLDTPIYIKTGSGDHLLKLLESPKRNFPIIYISKANNGQFLTDPGKLAHLLRGAAVVVAQNDMEVDEELRYLISKPLRAWGGAIRIYQPQFTQPAVKNGQEFEARRHNYFSPMEIENAPSDVAKDIFTRVMRSSIFSIKDSETSTDTVFEEVPKTSAPTSIPSSEKKLQDEINKLKAELKVAQELFDISDRQAVMLRAELDSLRITNRKPQEPRQPSLSIRELFLTLPTNLTEVVEKIEALYPDRIIFTKRAKATAKASSHQEPSKPWAILTGMATTLYDAVFSKQMDVRSIEGTFKNEVGFEISFSESGATKADKRLMNQRVDSHEGSTYQCEPHVKWRTRSGDQKDLPRIYFAIDRDRAKLIICVIGEHLNTAGTKRMH